MKRKPGGFGPVCIGLDGQRHQVDRLLFEDPGRLLPLLLVVVEPRPGGDELADDDVLLQAAQPVDLARDRGLGQDARRLLEGSCREPRGGVQRGLDQAEQHGLRRCGPTPGRGYAFWTSSTRKVWTASLPRMWRSSCGEIDPSVTC